MKIEFFLGLAASLLFSCSEALDVSPVAVQYYAVCAGGTAVGAPAKGVAVNFAAALGGTLAPDSLGFALEGEESVCDNRVHHAAWYYSWPKIGGEWSILILNARTGKVLGERRTANLSLSEPAL